jgi:intracellular septation protein A
MDRKYNGQVINKLLLSDRRSWVINWCFKLFYLTLFKVLHLLLKNFKNKVSRNFFKCFGLINRILLYELHKTVYCRTMLSKNEFDNMSCIFCKIKNVK